VELLFRPPSCTLTIPVGEELDQAIEAGVPHLPDIRGTAPDGLDGGGHKVLVHAADVGLCRHGGHTLHVTHMLVLGIPPCDGHTLGLFGATRGVGMASAHSSCGALFSPHHGGGLAPRAMPWWHPGGLSMAMAYLELPQDGGDVGLVGQVGEDLQLQKRGRYGQHGGMVPGHRVLAVLRSPGHGGQLPHSKGLHEAPKPPVMGSAGCFQLTLRILICVGSVERM